MNMMLEIAPQSPLYLRHVVDYCISGTRSTLQKMNQRLRLGPDIRTDSIMRDQRTNEPAQWKTSGTKIDHRMHHLLHWLQAAKKTCPLVVPPLPQYSCAISQERHPRHCWLRSAFFSSQQSCQCTHPFPRKFRALGMTRCLVTQLLNPNSRKRRRAAFKRVGGSKRWHEVSPKPSIDLDWPSSALRIAFLSLSHR